MWQQSRSVPSPRRPALPGPVPSAFPSSWWLHGHPRSCPVTGGSPLRPGSPRGRGWRHRKRWSSFVCLCLQITSLMQALEWLSCSVTSKNTWDIQCSRKFTCLHVYSQVITSSRVYKRYARRIPQIVWCFTLALHRCEVTSHVSWIETMLYLSQDYLKFSLNRPTGPIQS